jgi:hypothetical protein
MKTPESF